MKAALPSKRRSSLLLRLCHPSRSISENRFWRSISDFRDPPNSVYIGSVVDEITEFDIDRASFFEFRDYVMELGYPVNSSMFFKVPGLDFDRGLRRVESDKDVGVLLEHYKNSEVLTIYVERVHEPLMVVSPKGKILMQNIHTKGPLKQLPAAEVESASRKLHSEEYYVTDVEDETADEGSDDNQNQHHGHSDNSNDDDSEAEQDHIRLDPDGVI
ncbi:hypothetical protein AAC387_Pa02g1550 [Persea americana]